MPGTGTPAGSNMGGGDLASDAGRFGDDGDANGSPGVAGACVSCPPLIAANLPDVRVARKDV